jgi:MFS family permease
MSRGLSLSAAITMLSENRQYGYYVGGNFLSHVGDWAQKLAIGWVTWQLTRSPAWLGIILFWDLAPTLLISPIGGAVVDRMDRLKVVRVTVALSTLQPLVLAALYFTDLLNIWVLLGATIYLGAINAFGHTARLAMVPLLVAEKDIARAAPVSSISFNLARFAGPALFGVIATLADPGWAMVVNLFTFALFMVLLVFLKPRFEAINKRSGKSLATDIVDGFKYALSHAAVGPLLTVLLVSSVGTRAFIDLLPGFAEAVFGRGPEALSMMTSVVALGALTGAIYLTLRTSIVGLANVSMFASMWVGLMLIAFTSIQSFWLALVALYFVGTGLSISAVGVLSIVQSCVRGEMRGRALSIYGIIFRGGPALGGLIMGWIAEVTGLRLPVAGGGVICILAWLWVLSRLPEVNRNIEESLENPNKS